MEETNLQKGFMCVYIFIYIYITRHLQYLKKEMIK